MKAFVGLTITFLLSFELIAIDYGQDIILSINKMEIPKANPSDTKIIVEDKNFLILFNPKEFATTIIKQQAVEICSELNDKDIKIINFSYRIGVYTNFYSCNDYDHLNPESQFSQKEKEIRSMKFIFGVRQKYNEIINNLELEAENMRIQKLLDQEQDLVSKRNKLWLSHQQHLLSQQQDFLNKKADQNIIICERYGFVKKSEEYNNCIIKLIENPMNITYGRNTHD